MSIRQSFIYIFTLLCITLGCSKQLLYKSKRNNDKTKLKIRTLDLTEIKTKAKFKFIDKDNRINAKANIRVKKDSIIWVHLGISGIEGVRLRILKTGISMLDRMNKKAYEYSYETLSKLYDIELSYEQIENLLFANLFILPGQNDPKEIDSKQKYDVYQSKSNEIDIKWVVDKDSLVIKKTTFLQKKSNKQLIINYLSYTSLNDNLLPKHIKLEISDLNKNNNSSKMEVNLNLLKVEHPKKPLKYPYSIPKKYELINK